MMPTLSCEQAPSGTTFLSAPNHLPLDVHDRENERQRNTSVFPSEAPARERYVQIFLTLMCVSSTFQEALQALR